jgi:hypothetical protein
LCFWPFGSALRVRRPTAFLRGFKNQTLVAMLGALIAAYVAFRNTQRSLDHAGSLESRRRSRKHAALRAVLPLALAQVADYAERSAHALNRLISQCSDERLPQNIAPESLAQPLPSETLKTLAEFIEYSDHVDVSVIESTVAWMQIHDSRLRSIIEASCDPLGERLVFREELEGYIIDAASICAGAAAAFDYARRWQEHLPRSISWDDVRHALRNMRFWDEAHPRLHDWLTQLESKSSGPL